MLEEIIEKLKEYKLFVGLAVVGAVLGGFFLISEIINRENQVAALSQEELPRPAQLMKRV